MMCLKEPRTKQDHYSWVRVSHRAERPPYISLPPARGTCSQKPPPPGPSNSPDIRRHCSATHSSLHTPNVPRPGSQHSAPRLLTRHGPVPPFALLQLSRRAKAAGGLGMVLTNYLFLFRLTGFPSLRHTEECSCAAFRWGLGFSSSFSK